MNSTTLGSTKDRILDTASRLFSDKGYNDISMRNIAETVGISAPALYNHFANKNALYRVVISTEFDRKSAIFLTALTISDDPLQCLRKFVSAVVTEIHEDSRFHRLMQRELLDANEERLAFIGSFIFNDLERPFMRLLEQLKPGCDSFLLYEMIFGMAKQHYELRPLRSFVTSDEASERQTEQVTDMIMDILSAYFQAANPDISEQD